MMKKILTDRLQLFPVASQNAKELHKMWILPQVRKYLWDDRIISIQETQDIIDRSIIAFENNEYGLWLAKLREDRCLIGFCGYWPFFEPPQIQLIYGLDPDYWKQGFGTEIAKAMVEYGFNNYQFDTIYSACDADNIASVALMERIGMEFDKREEEVIFYRKVKLTSN